MSVRGKRDCDWVAETLCDFGERGRATSLGHHFSVGAAVRHFTWKRILRIYGPYGTSGKREKWRVWQALRATGEIINDTHDKDGNVKPSYRR